uniref:Winged helix-turn-helix domain-containing protein n=1 Tax=Stomoxys calcitrans TaxID=35570 RepID=A0A1I8PJU3_STOCA
MSTRNQPHPQMAPPPPPKPLKSQTYANGNGNGNLNANGNLVNGSAISNGNNPTFGLSAHDTNASIQKLNGRSPCHTPPRTDREQVVMTPKGKTANSTVILIERKLVDEVSERTHVAGGDHTGIIINKDTVAGQKSQTTPAQLSLEFRVFLVSANSGKHSQESRTLRFWFRDWLKNEENQAHIAQDFFKELVSPKDFPRDYVGFFQKIMKLMQKGYDEIQSLEIELRILEETAEPPSRPLSMDESQFESPPLTQEKVLELIEQAYPNPITPEDLAKDYGWEEQDVIMVFMSLKERGLIKSMEYNSYTRIHHEDKEIKVSRMIDD